MNQQVPSRNVPPLSPLEDPSRVIQGPSKGYIGPFKKELYKAILGPLKVYRKVIGSLMGCRRPFTGL